MARTVNATLRTVRRDAFLDVAQRLVQAKGYEAMSIQDVLDELEASKGAFYHYFDSKQALLEAVVEHFAEVAIADLAPVLNNPNLPALRKLERKLSFHRIGSMFCLFFTNGPVVDLDSARLSDRQRFAKFFHACLEGGIYFAPSQFETNFISTAHSASDIEETAKIMRETLANL